MSSTPQPSAEMATILLYASDRLTREKAETAKREPGPSDPSEAAERLAKKQRELAERTKRVKIAAFESPIVNAGIMRCAKVTDPLLGRSRSHGTA